MIEKTKLYRRQFEFFFCSALDETPQALELALSRLLLNFRTEPLHAVHCSLGGFLESPAERPLQRLNEDHEHEEKDGCRRFWR